MQNSHREWLSLGDTSVDLSQVLKISIGKDARLFTLAGDSLTLAAWTSDRKEIERLRQRVKQEGWITVVPDSPHEADYGDPEEPEYGNPNSADERLYLNFVDKVVETKTKNGQALEMFSSGIFVGEVFGDEIAVVKEFLGI